MLLLHGHGTHSVVLKCHFDDLFSSMLLWHVHPHTNAHKKIVFVRLQTLPVLRDDRECQGVAAALGRVEQMHKSMFR